MGVREEAEAIKACASEFREPKDSMAKMTSLALGSETARLAMYLEVFERTRALAAPQGTWAGVMVDARHGWVTETSR